jgi:hypothetical protein
VPTKNPTKRPTSSIPTTTTPTSKAQCNPCASTPEDFAVVPLHGLFSIRGLIQQTTFGI